MFVCFYRQTLQGEVTGIEKSLRNAFADHWVSHNNDGKQYVVIDVALNNETGLKLTVSTTPVELGTMCITMIRPLINKILAVGPGVARGVGFSRSLRPLPSFFSPLPGLFLALVCSAFDEDIVGGEKRSVLRFHPSIAPIKCAVFPLVKNKPEIVSKAREIYEKLQMRYNVVYDTSGAIGRRYRRMDEASRDQCPLLPPFFSPPLPPFSSSLTRSKVGTPFCVTVDFDSLEDDTVTIRERDSTEQVDRTTPATASSSHTVLLLCTPTMTSCLNPPPSHGGDHYLQLVLLSPPPSSLLPPFLLPPPSSLFPVLTFHPFISLTFSLSVGSRSMSCMRSCPRKLMASEPHKPGSLFLLHAQIV
eukprot:768793-Hanusia_phi.AAC.7